MLRVETQCGTRPRATPSRAKKCPEQPGRPGLRFRSLRTVARASVASARPIPQSLRARMSIRQYREAVSSGFWANSAPILPLPVEWGQRRGRRRGQRKCPEQPGRPGLRLRSLRTVARTSVASARPIPQSLRARLSIRQYREAVSSGFWANSAPILPYPSSGVYTKSKTCRMRRSSWRQFRESAIHR